MKKAIIPVMVAVAMVAGCAAPVSDTFSDLNAQAADEAESRGDYAAAEAELLRAARRARLEVTSSEVTVDSLINLGAFYYRRGMAYEGIPYLEQALEKSDRLLGPSSRESGMALTWLAASYFDQGSQVKGWELIDRLRPLVPLYPEGEHERKVAEVVLGRYDAYSRDCPRDVARWKDSAGSGNAEGQYQLAQTYLHCPGGADRIAEVLALLEASAGQGLQDAQFYLGVIYDKGLAVQVDKAKAREYFRIAAEKGYCWAQYNYSHMLATGQGGVRNRDESAAWLKKAAAADCSDCSDCRHAAASALKK